MIMPRSLTDSNHSEKVLSRPKDIKVPLSRARDGLQFPQGRMTAAQYADCKKAASKLQISRQIRQFQCRECRRSFMLADNHFMLQMRYHFVDEEARQFSGSPARYRTPDDDSL
jgi:hypothetical protein